MRSQNPIEELHIFTGFRLLEVCSLTLSSTVCPDLRGGCGSYLTDLHNAAERRGLFAIMAKEDEEGEHTTCFRDAVLFSGFNFILILE